MKITAVLSWFDESPTWLAYTVASCAKVADEIVAVDGAYALYPNRPRGSSGADQHDAIARAAEAAGLGFTIHVPREPWRGGEVEKRSRLMQLGSFLSEHRRDWLLVIDADEVVLEAPEKETVRAQLEETDLPVASCTFSARHDAYRWQPIGSPDWPEEKLLVSCAAPTMSAHRTRRFYRADRTIRLDGTHYHYRIDGDDGPVDLWTVHGASPALDLGRVVIEHRHDYRDPIRKEAGEAYYRIRNTNGVEVPPEVSR